MSNNFFITNYEASQQSIVFDETRQISNVQTIATSGTIDTTQIDQYRQGVEITSLQHFDKGTVKIHAGEPGHILPKSTLIDDVIFRQENNAYSEIDVFDPTKYLQYQDSLDQFYIFSTDHTWPIVAKDIDLASIYHFNGIIEPLSIRNIISFKEHNDPTQHTIKSTLEDGNIDFKSSTSQITTIDYFEHNNFSPYLDAIDLFGTIRTHEYLMSEQTNNKPFSDKTLKKDVQFSQNTSDDMIIALNATYDLTSSFMTCDQYVRYNQISTTTGFVYDDVQGVGVDSIAFGGLLF